MAFFDFLKTSGGSPPGGYQGTPPIGQGMPGAPGGLDPALMEHMKQQKLREMLFRFGASVTQASERGKNLGGALVEGLSGAAQAGGGNDVMEMLKMEEVLAERSGRQADADQARKQAALVDQLWSLDPAVAPAVGAGAVPDASASGASPGVGAPVAATGGGPREVQYASAMGVPQGAGSPVAATGGLGGAPPSRLKELASLIPPEIAQAYPELAMRTLTQSALKPDPVPDVTYEQVLGSELGGTAAGYEDDQLYDVPSDKTKKIAPMGGGGITVEAPEFPDTISLTSTVETTVQKKILNAQDTLAGLNRIDATMRNEYLTIPEKIWQEAAELGEKWGFDQSPETKARMYAYNTGRRNVASTLNAYINDLSGAAVSPDEAIRLQKALPKDDDGPVKFRAKLDGVLSEVRNTVARYNYALQNGLEINNYQDLDRQLTRGQFDTAFAKEANDEKQRLIGTGVPKAEAHVQALSLMRQKYGL